MQIGEPLRARIVPQSRESGSFAVVPRVFCGRRGCDGWVAEIGRYPNDGIHVVHLWVGFNKDADGVYTLTGDRLWAWRQAKRRGEPWRPGFRPSGSGNAWRSHGERRPYRGDHPDPASPLEARPLGAGPFRFRCPVCERLNRVDVLPRCSANCPICVDRSAVT